YASRRADDYRGPRGGHSACGRTTGDLAGYSPRRHPRVAGDRVESAARVDEPVVDCGAIPVELSRGALQLGGHGPSALSAPTYRPHVDFPHADHGPRGVSRQYLFRWRV